MLTVTVITKMNFKVKGCLFIENPSKNVGWEVQLLTMFYKVVKPTGLLSQLFK